VIDGEHQAEVDYNGTEKIGIHERVTVKFGPSSENVKQYPCGLDNAADAVRAEDARE